MSNQAQLQVQVQEEQLSGPRKTVYSGAMVKLGSKTMRCKRIFYAVLCGLSGINARRSGIYTGEMREHWPHDVTLNAELFP